MKRTKTLILNTLILTLTSFLIKTLDVSLNVYLTNKMGESAIGLFFLICAVYSMAVTFSSGGIKLAATRLTAENENRKKIINICIFYALTVGLIMGALLFSFSDLIAQLWIKEKIAAVPLKILSLSLPFVSMSSALGGYLTARRKVFKYSSVQILGELINILLCVFLLFNSAKKGLLFSCSAVVFSITVSQVVSFVLSFIFYKTAKERNTKTGNTLKNNIKSIFHIALPDFFGASARSVLLTVEHLLIPIGFRKSGQSAQKSMATYGVIHGMALPIVLYPNAVLTSLAQLLIPEIAKLKKENKIAKIEFAAEKTLKLTFIFALCVCGTMYLFSDELSVLIYKNTDCAKYLKLLAPLVPIMYTDTSVDGLLKGLDQQVYSMRYNILDSLLCVILVYTLIPKYCTKGYIFILFASEILNFALSLQRLLKVCKIKIDIKNTLIKPVICLLCAFAISKIFILSYLSSKLALTLSIVFISCIYICLLFLSGSFSDEDSALIKALLSKD